MNQLYRILVSVSVVLCGFGCAEPKVEEFGGPVEVTLKSPAGPGAGVPVKFVDEAAVARALGTLALSQEITNSQPEAVYADFFDTLTVSNRIGVLKTKVTGRVLVRELGLPHFVVAQQGDRLWVGSAEDIRDHRLPLGPGEMGGKHALDLLITQPGVLRELTASTMEMVRHGKIDQARAIARYARSQALMDKIDREEAAEQALKQNLRQLANSVDGLISNQAPTKEVLEQVSDEHGGELRSLAGHKGAVISVAYSPDGFCVLSGGEDGTMKLWEAGTGHELRTFTGHKAAVTSVAFSPDGSMAVSGSSDGTLRLWDIASGRELRATDSLGWKVAGVALSPNGKVVASAADDNKVKLWSLPGLQLLNSLSGHGWHVTSVAFGPGGDSFLSGSEDDTVKLWDASKGQETRTLQTGFTPVTCVAVSSDGQFGLSGGKDKVVRLWNLDSGHEIEQLKGHTQTVRGVAFTRDGRFAVSGSDDGTVRVWDVATGTQVCSFAGHGGAVTSVAVSPTGRYVASASVDGTVKIWQFPQSVWPRGEEVRK
jgi:WD40 repeat protein